ncbi:MAG: pentapeptide repeat-containing protein, partial [Cyanobacteria bacterium CRU_2_1]|nr:pentapeptide repeat-containing protein [Cyanobacteria bacterium CRU_2_1]
DLSGSNLREAVFYKAIVCEATLCGADLRRGVLREATLSGSDFSGVDLREAVLYEAALDGVDLHQVRVEQALFGHHPGLTAIEQSNLEVNLRAKGAIFQTFFDSTAVSPSHSFGRNGSAKFQPSDRVQDKHQTQAKQSYEEDIFSLPDNVDDSSLYEETYTIPEGLTESLFGNTLYISVKSVRPDSISFELGSLGYPNKEIDSVTVGYRIIYINKFDICLVSANDTDATFVVNRVEAPNPVN